MSTAFSLSYSAPVTLCSAGVFCFLCEAHQTFGKCMALRLDCSTPEISLIHVANF